MFYDVQPLCSAANTGTVEMIRPLVAAGIPINGQDIDRNTALHIAMQSVIFEEERQAVVDELKTCGADSSIRNRWNQTPEEYAEQAKNRMRR